MYGICSKRKILNECSLNDFNYQIDPYVGCEHQCLYCYALLDAESEWDREILMHENIIEQLEGEIESIPPQKIYFGYTTDPYQQFEKKYKQTRKALSLLQEKGFSASILTKSDLFIRDLDILTKMENASISISVSFENDLDRSCFEKKTINTLDRIEAVKIANHSGLKTSALLCPIIPYISNVEYFVELLGPIVNKIWIYPLSIQNKTDRTWQNVNSILASYYPTQKEKIEQAIFSKDNSYWTTLRDKLNYMDKHVNCELETHI